jgi:hypothetical protein
MIRVVFTRQLCRAFCISVSLCKLSGVKRCTLFGVPRDRGKPLFPNLMRLAPGTRLGPPRTVLRSRSQVTDILVAAAADPFAPPGRDLSTGVDERCPVVPVTGGLPAWLDGIADTGCIAASGSAVAVANQKGNLHVSADNCRTWSGRVARDVTKNIGSKRALREKKFSRTHAAGRRSVPLKNRISGLFVVVHLAGRTTR